MKKWNYSGIFLTEFDANYTGSIGNIFCQAVRNGAETVDDVMDYVERDCRRRLRSEYITTDAARNYNSLMQSTETDEAQEFAAHILWRESLPKETARKLKDEAKREGLNSLMEAQPPTEPQQSYLKSLFCPIVPKSKLEASNLIGEYLAKKAA